MPLFGAPPSAQKLNLALTGDERTTCLLLLWFSVSYPGELGLDLKLIIVEKTRGGGSSNTVMPTNDRLFLKVFL